MTMKYYDNSIYPIALVLSNDAESVNKYYRNADPNDNEEINADRKVLARTMFLSRRTEDDCYPMAVGIIFSKKPTFKVVVHEAFHAVLMMLDVGLNIPLADLTEEVYAYLIGWVGECIDNYLNETNNE